MTRRRVPRPALAVLGAAALLGTTVLTTGPASAASDTAHRSAAGTWSVTWTSQPAAGITSGGDGYLPAISGNGRVVTFTSDYRLNGDGAYYPDGMRSFVRRSGSPTAQRLAALPGGKLGNAQDFWGCDCQALSALSDDGHLAAFVSSSSNLTPGDTNATQDVFLRNLTTGAVTLVSHAPDGSPGDGPSDSPQMSRDGRWVLYNSEATNIDTTPGTSWDAYLYDTQSGVSHRVVSGLPYDATDGVLSGDGSTIAFTRTTAFGSTDVYVLDLATGTVSMVSVSKDGTPTHGIKPSISDDGSTVAYLSSVRNAKVVVANRQTHRSIKVPLPAGVSAYDVRISGDGKRLAIVRGPGSAIVLDVVDLTGAVQYEVQAGSWSGITPALDRDGSCVAYTSETPNVPQDTNGLLDVYTACEH